MNDSVPGPDVVDDPQTWAVLGEPTSNAIARPCRGSLSLTPTTVTARCCTRPIHPRISGRRPDWCRPCATWRRTTPPSIVTRSSARRCRPARGRPSCRTPASRSHKDSGWFVTDYRGTRLIWHFGHWGTGFSAMYLKIPAHRLTLILLANSEALADHHYQVGEDITHNVFACSFIKRSCRK